jgi:hypothetical protein
MVKPSDIEKVELEVQRVLQLNALHNHVAPLRAGGTPSLTTLCSHMKNTIMAYFSSLLTIRIMKLQHA